MRTLLLIVAIVINGTKSAEVHNFNMDWAASPGMVLYSTIFGNFNPRAELYTELIEESSHFYVTHILVHYPTRNIDANVSSSIHIMTTRSLGPYSLNFMLVSWMHNEELENWLWLELRKRITNNPEANYFILTQQPTDVLVFQRSLILCFYSVPTTSRLFLIRLERGRGREKKKFQYEVHCWTCPEHTMLLDSTGTNRSLSFRTYDTSFGALSYMQFICCMSCEQSERASK